MFSDQRVQPEVEDTGSDSDVSAGELRMSKILRKAPESSRRSGPAMDDAAARGSPVQIMLRMLKPRSHTQDRLPEIMGKRNGSTETKSGPPRHKSPQTQDRRPENVENSIPPELGPPSLEAHQQYTPGNKNKSKIIVGKSSRELCTRELVFNTAKTCI